MLGDEISGTARIVDELRTAGVPVYGLTNFSAETFPVARRRFPVLDRLDGVVVSGAEGIAKPDPELFEVLLSRYRLVPARPVVAGDLPADGVVTGTATVDGRPVCLMANDSTVKAGSWGARTVEKIIRSVETAYRTGVPMVWLVDSAGARITDQVDMFPGRRGAGKIFHTQVRASGSVPQVCALFGPSAAGGAYIPAFCDVVVMVDGNASMYLGSARMVEMVVGEKTTLEEMGGAKMHCSVSGVGHFLAKDEPEALETVRRYLSYLPSNWAQEPPQ